MQVTVSGGGSLHGNFSSPKQGARLRVSIDGALNGFVVVSDSGPDGSGPGHRHRRSVSRRGRLRACDSVWTPSPGRRLIVNPARACLPERPAYPSSARVIPLGSDRRRLDESHDGTILGCRLACGEKTARHNRRMLGVKPGKSPPVPETHGRTKVPSRCPESLCVK